MFIWILFLIFSSIFYLLPLKAKVVVYGVTLLVCILKLVKHFVPPLSKTSKPLNVLVTGGSQGIGKGFSHVFAKNGHNVIIVSRNEQKLQECVKELEKISNKSEAILGFVPSDFSKPSAAEELMERLEEMDFEVDVLVNNAISATCLGTLFIENELKQIDQSVNVNVLTPTKLTRLVLEGMKKRKFGKILNVSTVMSHLPLSFGVVYWASKTYMAAFSDSLYYDLKGRFKNIHVLNFMPGMTKTRNTKGREQQIDGKSELFGIQTALDCATKGYNDLMSGKTVTVASFSAGLLKYGMARILPTSLFVSLIEKDIKKMSDEKKKWKSSSTTTE